MIILNSAEYPRVSEWRTWQFSRSLSKRTVNERAAIVLRFAAWCRVNPELATTDDVVTWLAEGAAGEPWSPNTRWTYYTALAAWFRWLQKMDYRVDNPMLRTESPKRTKGQPHPNTNQEIQRLLAVRARRRTKAMILLATFEGFRAHEIAKVKGEHFDLIERTVRVTGKGSFTATLPLHHRVVEIAYQMPRKGYWFPGADRGHQRRESVCGTIKEAMIRAGITGSAHSLRHWFGTALLEAGVDIRVVQTLLRHQNLATTEIYTKVSERRRTEGIELLDPFRLEPLARVTPAMRAEAFGREFDVDDSSAA